MLGNTAAKGSSILEDWTKFFTSEKFKNLGAGLQGLASVASIGTSIYGLFQNNRALKMQRDALNEAKKQNAIENERWDKREAERLASNAVIADSAKLWDENNPSTRI